MGSIRVRTKLSSEDEEKFQRDYAKASRENKIHPDPDDPGHKYDYRGAWKAGFGPSGKPGE